MSGGVDSSVAACLLKEQGYDVVGVFMRLGAARAGEREDSRTGDTREGILAGGGAGNPGVHQDRPSDSPTSGSLAGEGEGASVDARTSVSLPVCQPGTATGRERHVGCCSAADAADARTVAGALGIPFYVLNFAHDFRELIDYFVAEYATARTPNPCILCNQRLKFGRLVEYAEAIRAEHVATGHYARVVPVDGRPRLWRARNREKDQSYVLFGIAPEVLRRTIFPLGDLSKEEVRGHARRLGLTLHDKPESQDICFVPDGDYARLVREQRPEVFRPGAIRHVDGRVLGEHEGLAHYTIGQRRGLRVAVGRPLYVIGLDPTTDTVIVGPREALLATAATAAQVSWLGDAPPGPFRAAVKIRYLHQAAPAEVIPLPGARVEVRFDEPQTAVTPGQAMVFYQGEEVLGGGWIEGR